ncbi:MAG: YdaS family helix-turn-helix protein [Acetobacteraceae bacterium]
MDGMDLIRGRRGLLAKVARECGVTRAAVVKWKKVPAERLPTVESATGIPRHLLRPDICPPPDVDETAKAA